MKGNLITNSISNASEWKARNKSQWIIKTKDSFRLKILGNIIVNFIVGKVDWNKRFSPSLSYQKKKNKRDRKKGNLLSGILFSYINFSNAVIMHCIASPYMHLSRHVIAYYTLIQICREYKWFFFAFVGIHVARRSRFDVVWEIDTSASEDWRENFLNCFFPAQVLRIWHYEEKELFGTQIW